MRRATIWSVATVLAVTLVSPRSAAAGIIDYIMELSGPEMYGVQVACEFNLRSPEHECRVLDLLNVSGTRDFRDTRKLWFTLTGGLYWTDGSRSKMRDFDPWSVWMQAIEPTVDFRWPRRGRFTFDTGAGGSFFFLQGDDFKPFANAGVKFVPVTVTYNRNFSIGYFQFSGVGVGYTLRFFPNPFTSQQFGVDPGEPNTHTGREYANGIVINLRWRDLP